MYSWDQRSHFNSKILVKMYFKIIEAGGETDKGKDRSLKQKIKSIIKRNKR